MKAFMVRDGEMQETEIPDGAMLLGIGSRLNPAGSELPPIEAIDYAARRYRRDGQWHTFPGRVVTFRDLEWTASR